MKAGLLCCTLSQAWFTPGKENPHKGERFWAGSRLHIAPLKTEGLTPGLWKTFTDVKVSVLKAVYCTSQNRVFHTRCVNYHKFDRYHVLEFLFCISHKQWVSHLGYKFSHRSRGIGKFQFGFSYLQAVLWLGYCFWVGLLFIDACFRGFYGWYV